MKRSKFSLSHYKLLSCKMGDLVPIGCVEVLPGDTFQHATNMLIRMAPMVAPVMHPCHARVHHWYVPNRLIWTNWENFITGGPDGMDTSVMPFIDVTSVAEGSLLDYLGIPPGITPQQVCALPNRAYNLIWNEWYRDQDLQPAVGISKGDGQDQSSRVLLKVAWEKDYFTTTRPWTQKGPVVSLPLTGNAPVTGLGWITSATAPSGSLVVREATGNTRTFQPAHDLGNTAGMAAEVLSPGGTDPRPNVFADLSGVTAANINDLRLAFALQRYEEARARYGSRYTEYLRYLGVRSSDARLQRPEYLGGGKQTVQFSEVLQTGPNDTENGQTIGSMHGHGIGAMRSNRYRRFFEEHGYVISVLSIKPRTVYSQSLNRSFSRTTKEDYYQRELQHIGQQEVHNREVYAPHSNPGGVFGYQDRYDEYRRQESTIAGQFRSTLNYWHMARDFAADPVLNASFVESNPTNRIFADQTGSDTLYVMASHSIQARRLLSASGSSFIF